MLTAKLFKQHSLVFKARTHTAKFTFVLMSLPIHFASVSTSHGTQGVAPSHLRNTQDNEALHSLFLGSKAGVVVLGGEVSLSKES